MSGKKSRASQSNDEPTPRPIALLLAVVFAGAISTWHWYRPLPQKATTVSNGPFVSQSDTVNVKESPRFKSKWKDSGLIFPSDDPTVEPKSNEATTVFEPSSKPNQGEDANPIASLTGNSELALQPFREATQPVQKSISQMPLPMVPVKPMQGLSPPSPPESRLWTATKRTPDASAYTPPAPEFQSHLQDTFAESASPFRVPRIDGGPRNHGPLASLKSEIWPDQGFDPKGAIASNQDRSTAIAHGSGVANAPAPTMSPTSDYPGLLSLSSNRIRTLEQEPETPPSSVPNGTVKPREPSLPTASSIANGIGSNPLRTPNVPKKGSMIRQPPPKTSVTK
jgi:hypothetical protein